MFGISWGQVFLFLHIAAVAVCVVRVLYRQRNTGAAFAWLIILFVFPLFGVAAYLLVGEPRLGMTRAKRVEQMNVFYRKFAERHFHDEDLDTRNKMRRRYQGIANVAASVTGLAASNNNAMRLLTRTDEIVDAMLADIQAARQTCALAFYIIEPQGRIQTLLAAVRDAAKRGVECTILADAVGSSAFFGSEWEGSLKDAGVRIVPALPVGVLKTFFSRSDLRNHRKILIVDNLIAYTGSFNLVDPRYFKQGAGVGEWVDVMMRCRGTVVLEMAAVFYADVAVETDEHLVEVQHEIEQLDGKIPELLALKRQSGDAVAQVIPSAPDQSDPVIYETIVCAIHAAKTRVTITTPYFVPDELLLTALTTAAKRGVEVVLILPEKVDSFLVRWASRAYYPKLLAAGVKIALFHGGLLHAKTLVVDEDYALFGTVNMDMRSFFLNLEISLAIYDAPVVQEIARVQQDYLRDSRYISVSRWQRREKIWGLVENTVRLFSPLL
nr:cardiolipin synthase [uncultured Kingella sp.]